VHVGFSFIARLPGFVPLKGSMPRPKAHYSLVLRNHHTGKRLRLELIDLPFAAGKGFRLRVHPVRIISVQVLRLRVTVSVR